MCMLKSLSPRPSLTASWARMNPSKRKQCIKVPGTDVPSQRVGDWPFEAQRARKLSLLDNSFTSWSFPKIVIIVKI